MVPDSLETPPPAPPPEVPPAAGEAEWDDMLLGSFGPRHWNLGCG